MVFKSLIPTQWEPHNKPFHYDLEYPFMTMHSDMDRFFSHLNTEFFDNNLFKVRSIHEQNHYPKVDITENENEFLVSAELPGIDDKDIQVSLDGETLIIKGEKKIGKENEKEEIYNRERYYGSFQRNFKLPETIDQSQIRANFDKGVLIVKLLKVCEPKKDIKKIPINN